ncbi:PCC domain-containing protein [Natronospora cellulosivora (SeqCode)]
MNSFIGEGLGRIIVLSFDRGDKLLEGVKKELADIGVENAVLLSAIGTLDKAVYHRITTTAEPPEDETLIIEGPIELSAVDGMVIKGEPHFHMVFTDLKETYSGHLEDDSTVLYLAELVLAEIKGLDIKRVNNGREIVET